jgi:hypothetical protein
MYFLNPCSANIMRGNLKREAADKPGISPVGHTEEFDPSILKESGGAVYLPKAPHQVLAALLNIEDSQMSDTVKRVKALAHLNARFAKQQPSKNVTSSQTPILTQKPRTKPKERSVPKMTGEQFRKLPPLTSHTTPPLNKEKQKPNEESFGPPLTIISTIQTPSASQSPAPASAQSFSTNSPTTPKSPTTVNPTHRINLARDPRRTSNQLRGRPTQLSGSQLVNEVTTAAAWDNNAPPERNSPPVKAPHTNTIHTSRDPRRRPPTSSSSVAPTTARTLPTHSVASNPVSRFLAVASSTGAGARTSLPAAVLSGVTIPADAEADTMSGQDDGARTAIGARDPMLGRGRDRP